MAEQWIDAASAAKLVAEGKSRFAAQRAICTRSHRGLIRTRARLFVLTEGKTIRRHENAAVPAMFWWAEGKEALTQDWALGDFSTWIDRTVHAQAFGVTFALSGVVELLSADPSLTVTGPASR